MEIEERRELPSTSPEELLWLHFRKLRNGLFCLMTKMRFGMMIGLPSLGERACDHEENGVRVWRIS
jgi:hypothetical protein